ncbi:MAG: HesA/MoeB/ThiF family protein [Candidatus Thorarchaeota archaeon]
MPLTPEQSERYSRMLALRDISEDDMESLMNTVVCVVGAGGLGSPALRLLAAIGFGHIRIIDRDVVELSNIQRQTLYNTDDIGKPKTEVAAVNLRRMNPNVKIEPISATIRNDNARDLLQGSDIIIDGLDTFEARRAVNIASLGLGIPYIYAGAVEYYANISTFIPGQTGCLECLTGDVQDNPDATCAMIGVSPTLLSIVASIEVREAVLLAIDQKPNLTGKLMHIDEENLSFDIFGIVRVENCLACSSGPISPSKVERDELVHTLCEGSYSISPSEVMSLDLKTIAEGLGDEYKVKVASTFLMVESMDGLKVTIMASGNSVVKGVNSPEAALDLYHSLLG